MEKGGKCEKCTLKNCLDCSFYEGQEKCYDCIEGYGIENGKCFDCRTLDKNCKFCDFGYYTVGNQKCFKCNIRNNLQLINVN